MAFTSEQLSYAGKAAMDYEIRQKPEDLYNTTRPLLMRLQQTRQVFPGAKQYIVEKLHITNDKNFQWFGSDDQVTFNRRRTLENANFAWGAAHDGFALSEDELAQNFISVTDDRDAAPTTSERHQFVNLIQENTRSLMGGFKEGLDYDLHLDGTQDTDAIAGLDALVAVDPTTGTVGGIDRSVAANAYWRNQVKLDVAIADLVEEMEILWRKCTRIGGHTPNFILAGSVFVDAYREATKSEVSRQINAAALQDGGVQIDPGLTGLNFKGVPITWDPVMDDLEANLGPAQQWDSRCYMLNTRYLKLRPMKGQDMVVRRPPRAYDRYTHYWGLTWRGAMSATHLACQGLITATGS